MSCSVQVPLEFMRSEKLENGVIIKYTKTVIHCVACFYSHYQNKTKILVHLAKMLSLRNHNVYTNMCGN